MSGASTSSTPAGSKSAYELERDEIIARNKARMVQLGVTADALKRDCPMML